MGLFGSRKKTYVGTSVIRVIEDKSIPDAAKTGLSKAIQAEGNIPDYVVEELLANIGRRAERSYRYAKEHSPSGLPFSQTLEVTMGNDEAETILSGIEGAAVDIGYCNLSVGNTFHFGWMKLIQLYGYNPETNELTSLSATKGFPVYLVDMIAVYPAEQEATLNLATVEQWGVSPKSGVTPSRIAVPVSTGFTPLRFDPLASNDSMEIIIEWERVYTEVVAGKTVEKKEILDETISFTIDTLDDEADYLHVRYVVNDMTKYWAYKIGSGTYPILDGLVNQPGQTFGEFFPYLYFRHAKTAIGDDKGSAAYKSAKRMGRILGLNYLDVHDAIHENPDIDDVEQAIMMFAVPMATDDPLEIRYLFDFMKKMYFTQERQFQFPSSAGLVSVNTGRNNSTRNGIIIKDALFEFALRHDGIFKRWVAGSIGSVGSYTRTYRTESRSHTVSYGDGYESTISEVIPVHTLRKQINSSMYEEIEVWGMKTVFKVFEQYETTGDEEDEIFIIPIDRSITKKYSMRDKEVLYARGMHYVFNSRVVVKLKWYQTGIFQVIMAIVAIVLIIWTSGQSIVAWANALAAGGAAAIGALTVLLEKILISFALKMFVKEIGTELAFLLAIAAFLLGAYNAISTGGTAGAPWVDTLVNLGNGLTNAIGSALKDMMGDLLNEQTQFVTDAKEKMELLEQQQSLLDQNVHLSPFVVFGETPNEFFNRTVHSGNIGVMSIEAVTNYVQVALTLPKLAETLGDSSYEQFAL